MSEQFYLEDKDISEGVFFNEPVPDENTIDAGTNLRLKRAVRNYINGLFSSTTVLTDSYGLLKEYALTLYKRLLEDDKSIPLRLDDPNEKKFVSMLVRLYGTPALHIGSTRE